MNAQLILAVINLIVKFGIPAVTAIVKQWEAEGKEITLEDIEALKTAEDIEKLKALLDAKNPK